MSFIGLYFIFPSPTHAVYQPAVPQHSQGALLEQALPSSSVLLLSRWGPGHQRTKLPEQQVAERDEGTETCLRGLDCIQLDVSF